MLLGMTEKLGGDAVAIGLSVALAIVTAIATGFRLLFKALMKAQADVLKEKEARLADLKRTKETLERLLEERHE